MFTDGIGSGQGWEAVVGQSSTPCSSLQPQPSRDGDKGLSLHVWLVGRNRTKLRPQLILTAWQEDREKCDTNTNPSSAAEESTASQISVLQVVSLQFIEKSWVCLGKMGQKLCSLNAKKEKGFSSSEAIVPSLPAGLGPTTAPSTAPPWDQGCSRVCRAQPTQQELGKN